MRGVRGWGKRGEGGGVRGVRGWGERGEGVEWEE